MTIPIDARRIHWADALARFLAAFVTETLRDDCLPEMRFRARMPDGMVVYRPTRIEAEAVLIQAVLGEPERPCPN